MHSNIISNYIGHKYNQGHLKIILPCHFQGTKISRIVLKLFTVYMQDSYVVMELNGLIDSDWINKCGNTWKMIVSKLLFFLLFFLI